MRQDTDPLITTKSLGREAQQLIDTAGISIRWTQIQSKPDVFPPAPHNHTLDQVQGLEAVLTAKADLDRAGRLLTQQAPAEFLTLVYNVDSEAGMLTSAAKPGHIVRRTDQNNALYFLIASPASDRQNWAQIRSEAGTAVTSVQGRVGEVTLTAGDLGAAPAFQVAKHLADMNNPHGVTKSQVGLGHVTNDAQVPLAQKGQPGGVAELDSSGFILPAQLPPTFGAVSVQLGTVSSRQRDLASGEVRHEVLTLPANAFYGRQVTALGVQQIQGDILDVQFFEEGETERPETWSARRYGAEFRFYSGVYLSVDTAEGPLYVDAAGLKQLRVRLENKGSEPIQGAGVSVQFTYWS